MIRKYYEKYQKISVLNKPYVICKSDIDITNKTVKLKLTNSISKTIDTKTLPYNNHETGIRLNTSHSIQNMPDILMKLLN